MTSVRAILIDLTSQKGGFYEWDIFNYNHNIGGYILITIQNL